MISRNAKCPKCNYTGNVKLLKPIINIFKYYYKCRKCGTCYAQEEKMIKIIKNKIRQYCNTCGQRLLWITEKDKIVGHCECGKITHDTVPNLD